VIQPSLSGPTYYQAGNITVESGGTLIVRNVVISFVEFVADTGTAQQRLSHVYFFHDAGTVDFYNASLTTDVQVLNAYAKLNLTVTGDLNAWNSTFRFPGWLYIDGASAGVTLNNTVVTSNPDVALLAGGEPNAILGDTLWAPTITVLAGAKLTLLGSTIESVYADNTLANGFARPTPLNYTNTAGVIVDPGYSTSLPVNGPSDSADLALDWLYPAAGALSGYASVTYAGSSLGDSSVEVSVVYGGTSYSLGTVTFVSNTTTTLELPFSATLLHAITAGGMLQYLNNTGDFGVTGVIEVTIDDLSGAPADVHYLAFQLNTTGPSYNDLVTGAGSTVSAINSVLGFNFQLYNATPGAAYSQVAPLPWNSNKFLFTDDAVAYLANVTSPSSLPGVFYPSAFLPDPTSAVYTYRWAEFNLTGRDAVLPIQGARVSAFYAYTTNQENNYTTTALNQIASTVPAIWGYVQYWDGLQGVSSYGTSNAAGEAFLLLAASNITAATLPDGIALGNYHIGITVPAVDVPSQWFNWSVSPYPTGVAAGSYGYKGPDFAPMQEFQNYFGAMTVTGISILANSVANTTVRIGQVLGVKVTVEDAGTATITQIGGQLYYNGTKVLLAQYGAVNLDLTAPGQETNFTLSWVVNETVTGLHGWFDHTLSIAFLWNKGVPSLAGGALHENTTVKFAPSDIAFSAFAPPPSTINLDQSYISSGTVVFNGSQQATLTLWAWPEGGGTPIEIAATPSYTGNFTMTWFNLQQIVPSLAPGTTYTLKATATYNGRETNYTLPGTYTVPAAPSSPASFLFQKFLGLPLWVWLAIAAAAAVAIVLFLLVVRRQAAGKLVECGECGNLIPEDATVCPKCGAEFESDLIRCSRCASTIPADSKFCPECAAQLLGAPGEAAADPEKQAYADFTEKYRAEAKRELGDNYSEGAFWDWWKRQPTYTPFSQWSLQQGQGTARVGMTAPPAGTEAKPEAPSPTPAKKQPPKGGGPGWTEGPPAGAAAPAAEAAAPPTTPPGAGLKACPNCGKEIPAEYLVCPFCNAVTQ
jgi:RNA polymerase subunit RPABC4/transcription elongation factor Spt4